MKQPKYRAIAEQLRDECARLDEGAQLPAEKELANRYDVSPMTIRQALDVLEGDGIVTRVFARGTYVQKRVVAKGDAITSFSDDMRMRGLTPSTRLLGIDVVPAPDAVALDLKLGVREKVLELERLRLADGDPMCLEVAHLPERFSRIVSDAPDGSLHALLQHAGIALASGTRKIRAVLATDRQSALLAVPQGSPVLHIVQVFADEHGRPVQRADAVYRADRYEAYTRIRRQ